MSAQTDRLLVWRLIRCDALGLPVRVERPREVFNPSVLSVRWVPGRRISSNAIPANGLFAPTSDRCEDRGMQRPSELGPGARQLVIGHLGLTRMAGRSIPAMDRVPLQR
jgi:hypothetical protein